MSRNFSLGTTLSAAYQADFVFAILSTA